jgi:hypothetical protein
MARDDDDDRPRKKRSRDEDEVQEETAIEADDDRPRVKSSRADVEKTAKPMPVRLVGAIIACLAWGFLSLYGSCMQSSNGVFQEIHTWRARRDAEENQRKVRDEMRKAGIDIRVDGGDLGGGGNGLRYTILGTHIFLLLTSVLLVVGGIMLLMRMSMAKFVAMGAPVAMLLVEFVAFVICLIITKGTFMAHYNVEFLVNIFFSLVTAGCIAFLLLNKEVSKALK